MKVEGYEFRFFDRSTASDGLWQASADLMLAAFQWPITVERLKDLMERDVRHHGGPIGTCALDGGGRMVGYCGIARRPLLHGGEVVRTAHLWTIAVRQDHTHRGVGMALIEMALGQLRDEGIEDVTLYTTPALVAYRIYGRLGFRDHHLHNAWLSPSTWTRGEADALRPLEADEIDEVGTLFRKHMGGLEGFSVREGDPYEGYRALGYLEPGQFKTSDSPGELEGYVFMGSGGGRGFSAITEFVGPDTEWYLTALRAVLAGPEVEQVMVTHRNPLAIEALEAEGFRWTDLHTYQRMMALGRISDVPEAAWGPGWFLESRLDVF